MAPKKPIKSQEETLTDVGFVKPKDKGGRPRVYVPKNTITRENRVPLDGIRDVFPKVVEDPNYHYTWPIDDDENGYVIMQFLQAGYNFVQSKEQKLARTSVYTSKDVGSIVRVPNRDGRYHYLMKIPMDLYKLDQANQLNKVAEMEAQTAKERFEGSYGSIKIGNN